MNYRQRLIDAAEAAEFAAKLDAGIAKEVEKLEYVRVHKSCLEKLKEEVSYLRTRETNHMAYIAELEERQAEIERLREELAAMKAMDAYPNTLRDLNDD